VTDLGDKQLCLCLLTGFKFCHNFTVTFFLNIFVGKPIYSHQRHATGSRDIQNGWILSGQASYMLLLFRNFKALYPFKV
jgi:hypothetical protein